MATTDLLLPSAPPARTTPFRPVPVELWLRWCGSLLIAGIRLLTASTYGQLTWWQFGLLHFFISSCYWHTVAHTFFWMQRRHPGQANTTRRLLLTMLLGCFLIPLYGLLATGLERHFQLVGPTFLAAYLGRLKVTSMLWIVSMSEYECFYFVGEWRRSKLRAAEFERENALSRLETLKQRVDPLLLFDSLQALNELTSGNQPVQEFGGALASVYQYVLRCKSTSTVPLSEEMTFVDDYLYLNQIRFQGSIQVEQHLDPATLRLHVPPITVQMLVENAIKHSAFSNQQPLRIIIRAADDTLTVSNSVRRKTIPAKSTTKQGLQNIINRFALLTKSPLRIEDHGDRFEVVLPLLPATV